MTIPDLSHHYPAAFLATSFTEQPFYGPPSVTHIVRVYITIDTLEKKYNSDPLTEIILLIHTIQQTI